MAVKVRGYSKKAYYFNRMKLVGDDGTSYALDGALCGQGRPLTHMTGEAIVMKWQEYDNADNDGDDFRSGRPRRTKFREREEQHHGHAGRAGRFGKKSRRSQTVKDDFWAAVDRQGNL